MSEVRIVTDPPDPDCYRCEGGGVVGGCSDDAYRCNHLHTYSFCRCVNERTVEVTDDDTG